MKTYQNVKNQKGEMSTMQFTLSMVVCVVLFAFVLTFASRSFGYFNSYNAAQKYTQNAIQERQEENLNSIQGMSLLP